MIAGGLYSRGCMQMKSVVLCNTVMRMGIDILYLPSDITGSKVQTKILLEVLLARVSQNF
jgi:hypothetical protein